MKCFFETNGRPARPAFTLVEVMVAISLMAIVGTLIYTDYMAGITLFGKNLATNTSAQFSRDSFDVLSRDMHLDIGPPQLINSSLAPVSGNGPSAGVALRYYAAGPCVLAQDTASTDTTIKISQIAGFTPQAGDLLSLPAFAFEATVTTVGGGGSNSNLSLSTAIGQQITNTGTTNYVAFLSRQVGYVVVGSSLRRYPNLAQPGTYTVIANGITSATPFRIPVSGGVADPRYISVSLSVTNPAYTKRNWRSVDSLLNFTIAYRVPTPLTMQ